MAATQLRDFRPRIFLNLFAVAYGAILLDLLTRSLVESVLSGAGLTATSILAPLRQSFIVGLPMVLIFDSYIIWRLRALQPIVVAARNGAQIESAAQRQARAVLRRLPRTILVAGMIGFSVGGVLGQVVTKGIAEMLSLQGFFVLLAGLAFGGLWAQLMNSGNDLILADVRRQLKVHFIDPDLGDEVHSVVYKRSMEMGYLAAAFFLDGLLFANEVVRGFTIAGAETAARVPGALIIQVLTLTLIGTVYIVIIARSQALQVRAAKTRLAGVLAGATDAGNLIEVSETDEIGELVTMINRFTLMQQGTVQRLTESSRLVADASRRLDAAIQQVSAGSEEMVASLEQVDKSVERRLSVVEETKARFEEFLQSSNRIMHSLERQTFFVDETSSAVSEMAANIRSVTQSAGSATQLAQNLSSVARERGAAVQQTIAAIQQIDRASSRVNEIVGVISKISAQTNMLAMNAAIEAAHAGDAGRGFAVVAEEVRSLASGSAANAKQINEHIREMVKQVEQGVTLSTQAGEALRKIEEGVDQTTGMIEQISGAMREQSAGTTHILESINALVESATQMKDEALGQERRNAETGVQIQQIVDVFQEIRVATREQTAGSREILAAVSTLREVAATNNAAVAKLEQVLTKMG